ncbi:MAG: pilus assembly protein PilM, partial [Candidatus Binatia bacterium]
RVELPAMTFEELRQALPWEARRHIAGLPEDAIVDAQVLSHGSQTSPMEILLVAFPRPQYERVESLCARAGIAAEFVDLGQLSTMNALSGARPSSEVVGLLDLGADDAFFAAFSSSNLVLFRDLSVRAARLDALLAERFGLGPADVETLKTSGKLPGGGAPSPAKLEEALGEVIGELAEDLRSGLVYLENRTGTTLERVHLTGGSAAFVERQGIADAIAAQSGVTLERFDPFHGFRFGLIDEAGLRVAVSELCAAAGVAIRFFGAA